VKSWKKQGINKQATQNWRKGEGESTRYPGQNCQNEDSCKQTLFHPSEAFRFGPSLCHELSLSLSGCIRTNSQTNQTLLQSSNLQSDVNPHTKKNAAVAAAAAAKKSAPPSFISIFQHLSLLHSSIIIIIIITTTNPFLQQSQETKSSPQKTTIQTCLPNHPSMSITFQKVKNSMPQSQDLSQ